MSKSTQLAFFCAIFSSWCFSTYSSGQVLTGSSLSVSGSATIGSIYSDYASVNSLDSGTACVNALSVGTLDILGNSLPLGTVDGTQDYYWMNNRPGVEACYNDMPYRSSFSFISSRDCHDWIWASRPFGWGDPTEPVTTMELSANHVLTIYDTNGNPGIVLDPANQRGSTSVLTVQTADERYLSRSAITVGNGSSIAFTGGNATGAYSFAGMYATASGYNSIALGNCSSANGFRSISFGDCSTAHGDNSVALGANAIASGNFSFATGYSSTASGISSSAFGAYSAALGDYSIAAGPSTTSSGFAQFVIGQNNVPQGDPGNWVSSDNLFIIGNGAPYSFDAWVDGYYVYGYIDYYDENGNYTYTETTTTWVDGYFQTEWATGTSNAFVVKKNGDTTVYGSLTVSAPDGSTAATPAGFSTAYSDGSNGVGASITQSATRPTAVWNWQRLAASGSAVPMMQIDASNRLVLTGTATVNPPQLVLDPNGEAGSAGVLTQASADSRYVINGGSAGTVLGNTTISGSMAIAGAGSFTLPDGTVLSASRTLSSVVASSTVSTISGTILPSQVAGLAAVATTGNYGSLAGLPTIPTDNSQLANGAGYITSTGSAAYAANSGMATQAEALTGTISASQVSGTASNLALSGTTNIAGAMNVTGTARVNALTVSGTVDMQGNALLFGTVSDTNALINDQPGIKALYSDGATSSFSLVAARPSHQWIWSHSTDASGTSTSQMMVLDQNSVLTVYDNYGGSASIDPQDPPVSRSIADLRDREAEFAYDQRYVPLSQISINSGWFPIWGDWIPGTTITLTGGGATATGPNSMAWAIGANSSGYFSNAGGANSSASGDYSVALGYGANAAGWSSLALGPWSTASGYASISLGSGARAIADWSIASGHGSTTNGFGSVASAYSSTTSGVYSIASGVNSISSGSFSVASGYSSTASGVYSSALGAFSVASGTLSTAIGAYSISKGNYSVTAGPNTTGSGFGQFIVGQYNVPQGDPSNWIPGDDLFIVGNGVPYAVNTWVEGHYSDQLTFVENYDENGNWISETSYYPYIDGHYDTQMFYPKSNAFVVKKNGDTTVYGKLTVSAPDGSTAATPAGFSTAYTDGSNGAGASITQSATRPTAVWNWQRLAASGSSAPVMQIDSSNRLVLTGTSKENPPQLVLDPNGQAGSSGVLTQASADSRYVVNGGSAGTVLANTAITGTAAVTGGLAVTGTATLNGDALLTQTAANAQYVLASSGTASNLALSGTTNMDGAVNVTGTARVTGGMVVTGTLDASTNTVVATDSGHLLLIPQQGDLSMGNFTAGAKPQ